MSTPTLDAYGFTDLTWRDNDYYFPSGRKVSKKQIFHIIKAEQNAIADQLDQTINRLLIGETSFENWQRETARIVKDGHVAMMRYGRGGKDKTYAIHYLDVANELRKVQYPHLRDFASDIRAGKMTEKQIRARMRMYAYSPKVSFERGRHWVERTIGKKEGLRMLGSCAKHCQSCINYARLGWVPIADLILPGVACECGPYCCCSIKYR